MPCLSNAMRIHVLVARVQSEGWPCRRGTQLNPSVTSRERWQRGGKGEAERKRGRRRLGRGRGGKESVHSGKRTGRGQVQVQLSTDPALANDHLASRAPTSSPSSLPSTILLNSLYTFARIFRSSLDVFRLRAAVRSTESLGCCQQTAGTG